MSHFLILTADYPNNEGGLNLAYVRTRNVFYKEHNIKITVLNFTTKKNYIIDGIEVISYEWFKIHSEPLKYDIVICHAPNLRNHYKFLKKYGDEFEKIVFFYHGHEVLKINKVYSKPYNYVKRNYILEHLQNIYDEIKFRVWRSFIKRNHQKLYHIFVSQWMKNEFLKWIKPEPKYIEGRNFITYNCVGEVFEKDTFDYNSKKDYDFVTIRANLDGSKYCVDVVNNLAKLHPEYKFLLIGQGDFFSHYEKASNLDWINSRLQHDEMIKILNSAHCALMPTRTDAQGVMMCEMAAFGMPVITSDIPVCHEIFKDEPNIGYINNNLNPDTLVEEYNRVRDVHYKSDKYFMKNTGEKELNILTKIMSTL
ncbi:MAG: glycosyltransferase family 4 protein [Muribaculaceae bacterium]|nr:glycosyltransferase family 4 protein [Muribaculaceae bacterium]